MQCPKCVHEYNEEESKFCPECGTPSSFYCAKCGKQHSQKFCPDCGTPVAELAEPQQPQPAAQAPAQPNIIINNTNTNTNIAGGGGVAISPKSKMVTLLLCIFLGYLGGHCFYTGKVGMGILYLFTVGLCGIGWIVDLIKIITGSYRDGVGRVVQN